jgi:hypothetical protein
MKKRSMAGKGMIIPCWMLNFSSFLFCVISGQRMELKSIHKEIEKTDTAKPERTDKIGDRTPYGEIRRREDRKEKRNEEEKLSYR